MRDQVLQRFLDYVGFDTQSDADSKSCPSTEKQKNLGAHLVEELKKVGLKDAKMDSNGYVMATLPATDGVKVPAIGFIAHMDTSPDMSGANVKPRLVTKYDGKDIVLHKEQNIVLSPNEFPELAHYEGQELVVTDGTTLLGADNKAGIAEIVAAMEYLIAHPEIPHGTIRVAFTPDEEIGAGADHFDVKEFDCAFAYTVDGGELGELEYETFNAAGAKLEFRGRNVHPGSAKNKMINAVHLAMEFDSMLPRAEVPYHTEGYEGFYHLTHLSGGVENASMSYIIRDHCRDVFAVRKNRMEKVTAYMNEKHGAGTVNLTLQDQYYNMREKIEPVFEIVELASRAMESLGITPKYNPVRGGTDGARLSFMGLPCPNLFTGGHNYHGRYEYVCVESMVKAVEVIVKIAEFHAKGK